MLRRPARAKRFDEEQKNLVTLYSQLAVAPFCPFWLPQSPHFVRHLATKVFLAARVSQYDYGFVVWLISFLALIPFALSHFLVIKGVTYLPLFSVYRYNLLYELYVKAPIEAIIVELGAIIVGWQLLFQAGKPVGIALLGLNHRIKVSVALQFETQLAFRRTIDAIVDHLVCLRQAVRRQMDNCLAAYSISLNLLTLLYLTLFIPLLIVYNWDPALTTARWGSEYMFGMVVALIALTTVFFVGSHANNATAQTANWLEALYRNKPTAELFSSQPTKKQTHPKTQAQTSTKLGGQMKALHSSLGSGSVFTAFPVSGDHTHQRDGITSRGRRPLRKQFVARLTHPGEMIRKGSKKKRRWQRRVRIVELAEKALQWSKTCDTVNVMGFSLSETVVVLFAGISILVLATFLSDSSLLDKFSIY